jgi:hypothetical protein
LNRFVGNLHRRLSDQLDAIDEIASRAVFAINVGTSHPMSPYEVAERSRRLVYGQYRGRTVSLVNSREQNI